MFLIARLFGVFTYTLIMLVFVFLIKYSQQRQTKYYFIAYFIVLCLMAYFYIPYQTTDVFRHHIYAQSLAQMSFADFWYKITNSVSGIFTLFYFRYFSEYLCLVTCIFIYGIIFNIIYDSFKRLNAPNLAVAVTLFWIMTNDFYLIAITTIRSHIAVGFVAYCIYREIFKRKFGLLNVLLYFCAIQMHAMGIVLVTFRFIAYLFMKGQISLGKIILFPMIIGVVALGTGYYIPMFESAADKFESYYTEKLYDYVWERVIFIIQLLVQIYILYKAYAYKIFRDKKFVYYKSAVVYSVLIFAITSINIVFMQRWIFFSAILEIPVLVELLKREKELHKENIKRFVVVSSIITFAIVASRGNLCSLKFWE